MRYRLPATRRSRPLIIAFGLGLLLANAPGISDVEAADKGVTRFGITPPAEKAVRQPGLRKLGVDGPDLAPEPGAGSSYCSWLLQGTKAERTIKVKVKNNGTQIANPTDMFFDFDGALSGTKPIGGYVYAGGYKSVDLLIPEDCFGADGICNFQIEVDHAQLINETNEGNNGASGSCTPQ